MSHHLVDLLVLNSVHSHDYKLTNDQSLQLCLSSNPLPSGQLYWTSPPTLIDNGFQVHLRTCSITASKFPQSWPPRAPPHSLTHALQVTAVMGSKWISKLVQLRPAKVCLSSHDPSLQVYPGVHSTSACRCICKVARLWLPSRSPSSYNHSVVNWW